MKVANKKIIRLLSYKSMRSAGTRNSVAVIAIALTTVLFTALLTIAMSIVYGAQQSNFRQVGGYEHGSFNYITKEQVDQLKTDPLIKEYGIKYVVGLAFDGLFTKDNVEITYVDKNEAKFGYIMPTNGHLPAENTNEAATDTRVLSLLGIEPELGAEFDMTFNVEGEDTTQTFILSGWWEYDPISPANQMVIPMSRAEAVFEQLGATGRDGHTMTYVLDVMFNNSSNISGKMNTILERYGYQNENASESNYISTGVNWGYVSAQLNASLDFMTILALLVAVLLIGFTGYLIIYNVFQISVSNDIRSYGLLKTVGTTRRQIQRIVRIQSLLLSCIGIPIGLILGHAVGAVLLPFVIRDLSWMQSGALSVSPWIFIGSAAFSLITVFISCRKPAKMAGRVSPIEALKYTEGSGIRRKRRGAKKGASIFVMASANLGREKRKTLITMLSMSLSVVILQITMILTNGFDMDKYLKDIVVDFIVADASYFNTATSFNNLDKGTSEEVISEINENSGITDSGRTYGNLFLITNQYVTEDVFRNDNYRKMYNSDAQIDSMVEKSRSENGLLADSIDIYGMEKFCLDKQTVLAGDITKLYSEGNYIASVYFPDDYGNVSEDSHWAKVGDTVTIQYVDEYEFYNPETGKVYPSLDEIDGPVDERILSYHDVEYEVAAEIVLSSTLNYRTYGSDQYVLGADTYLRDRQNDCIMYYAFDTTDEARTDMEEFIENYTQNVKIAYDYESRKSTEEEFYDFQNMCRLMGGVLSFIVGAVGVLNFFNAILTGIAVRRHEFAILQSVGMTGKQLSQMLITEGILYALGTAALSALLSVTVGPLIGEAFGNTFPFFTYQFTIGPIFIMAPIFIMLGIAIPIAAYRLNAMKSVVERLREIA